MRALVSVYNKEGIVSCARRLHSLGVELFSTSGTKKALKDVELPVHDIAEMTSFPEILDGRVKTLHPAVHGGILARRDIPEHENQLHKHDLSPIDMVICNLYPFEATVKKKDVSETDALENIDIGGPTMIRSAAKNFPHVLVLTDPEQYDVVLDELEQQGSVSLKTRRQLATAAFQHTAYYDSVIARYFQNTFVALQCAEEDKDTADNDTLTTPILGENPRFPTTLTLGFQKVQDLRYGENPQQQAAFYRQRMLSGIADAVQHQGKQLSFNNILDTDAALSLVLGEDEPTVSIIKHVNPCGIAIRPNITQAFQAALGSDPLSAFGGIIAANRPIDEGTAEEISKLFFEVIIAPGFDRGALRILSKKKKVRLLELPNWVELQKSMENPAASCLSYDLRRVRGGVLIQTKDCYQDDPDSFEVVTKKQPTKSEWDDVLFAWRVVGRVKSNAIVLATEKAVVGIGAGQMSRVDAVELAVKKAGKDAEGTVLASDAFFPFADGVEVAAEAGITTIAQPCGSIRDKDVIAAADSLGIAMIKTGTRHFLH